MVIVYAVVVYVVVVYAVIVYAVVVYAMVVYAGRSLVFLYVILSGESRALCRDFIELI
jgi:hypothetical protein